MLFAPEHEEKHRKEIIDMLGGERKLWSKIGLSEKFITENLPTIDESNISEITERIFDYLVDRFAA